MQPRLPDPEWVETQVRERIVQMKSQAGITPNWHTERMIQQVVTAALAHTEKQVSRFLAVIQPKHPFFNEQNRNFSMSKSADALISFLQESSHRIPIRFCRRCWALNEQGSFCECCIVEEFPYIGLHQHDAWILWKRVQETGDGTYHGNMGCEYSLEKSVLPVGAHNWYPSALEAIAHSRPGRDLIMAGVLPRRRTYVDDQLIGDAWGSVLPLAVFPINALPINKGDALKWRSDAEAYAPLINHFEATIHDQLEDVLYRHMANIEKLVAEEL